MPGAQARTGEPSARETIAEHHTSGRSSRAPGASRTKSIRLAAKVKALKAENVALKTENVALKRRSRACSG